MFWFIRSVLVTSGLLKSFFLHVVLEMCGSFATGDLVNLYRSRAAELPEKQWVLVSDLKQTPSNRNGSDSWIFVYALKRISS
ncbi:MAG TPA: hypothetical protein DDY14_16855 [Chromatiaceae bacterium]|nr:MAG: hypothetical protein N838_24845 [Thiohalocapsa sp. PB-PSB1]HBG96952.1 hypothetical protein [Chromatiaceae bacterium]HCS92850.1 hypothetical protein [Chromatiaceae bacterium]